jgi:hypothetical protein
MGSLNLTLGGGVWSPSCLQCLTPWKEPQSSLDRRWAPGLVWTFSRRENSPATAGIRTPDHPACSLITMMTILSSYEKCTHTTYTLHLPKLTWSLVSRPNRMYRIVPDLRGNTILIKLIRSSLTNLFLHRGPTPRIRVSPFQLHSDSPPHSQCICIPLLHSYKQTNKKLRMST